MQVEVNIEADAINEQLAKAVIESAIGAEIKSQIEQRLKDPYHLGEAVKSAVEKVIGMEISKILSGPEASKVIADAVRNKLTDEFVEKLTMEAWSKLVNNRY